MKNRNKSIYVIGPVTGMPNLNAPQFSRVQLLLRRKGLRAVIPHDIIPPSASHEEAMRSSISFMTRYADGVAVLDGASNSPGASLEIAVAEACGIEWRPWRDWL